MTGLPRTREALMLGVRNGLTYDDADDALAEIEAAEAVISAARDLVRFDTFKHARALAYALARLDRIGSGSA